MSEKFVLDLTKHNNTLQHLILSVICEDASKGDPCLSPKEDPNRVHEYNFACLRETLDHFDKTGQIWDVKNVPKLRKQLEYLESGGRVCDEFGEYINEFTLL